MRLPTANVTSLSRQITSFMLFFALVCVLGIGSLLTYLGYVTVRGDTVNLLEAKTHAARLEIESYLDDLRHKLDYLARIQGLTDLPTEVQQRLLQALLRHNKAYEVVLIADDRGRTVCSAGKPGVLAPRDITNLPAFRQSFDERTDYTGLLEIDTDLGVPVLDLAVPVRDRRDEVSGVLWARLNLKFLLYVLSELKIGRTGYAYLLDNRNVLLAPQAGGDFRFGPASSSLPRSLHLNHPLMHDSKSYTGLRGQRVLGAVDAIRAVNGRWRLIIEYPASEAYGSLYHMLWTMLAFLGSALVLGGGLAMVLSRRFVKPLTMLTTAARSLGAGDLSVRVHYDRNNELGLLAESFNTMAGSLQQEITERKRAEHSLKENESRFRVLFEASPISLWEEDFSRVKARLDELQASGLADLEEHFISHPDEVAQLVDQVELQNVNAATMKLLEARDKDELLSGLGTVFTPESLAVFQQELLCLARGDKAFSAEIVHKTLIGGEIQALLHLAVAPGYEDTLGKVLVSLQDITERKRAEQEKARLEEQLLQAQKMEALGQLSSGIAHDFNNLLQAISGYVQLLLMKKTTGDPDYKYLVEVERSASRAADLIRRLLTFSRRIEVRLIPVNLNQVILDTVTMLQRTLPKMVHIETILTTDLAVIQADPTQIEQVIMNLATNAVDAMDQQGTLTIKTENFLVDHRYRNKYLELQAGDYVLLKVTDTGCGIDETTRQRIFEPFFTTKEKGRGTGLGLATVYGIVKGHSGHITCYTTPGVGTTFNIYLPVGLLATIEDDDKPASTRIIRGGRETLLLVDDETIILDIAEDAFRQHGYAVFRATSGEEALSWLTRSGNRADLVLLDLGMPGMGGERTLKRMLERDPQLQVIVASGYGAHAIARNPAAFGVAAFLSKPYRLEELLETVRNVLDRDLSGPRPLDEA